MILQCLLFSWLIVSISGETDEKKRCSCYTFENGTPQRLSWPQAQSSCKFNKKHLVVMETEQEWEFIKNEIQTRKAARYDEWHIGLYRNLTTGNWTWNNGKPLTIDKWQKNNPEDSDFYTLIFKEYPFGHKGSFCTISGNVYRAWICEEETDNCQGVCFIHFPLPTNSTPVKTTSPSPTTQIDIKSTTAYDQTYVSASATTIPTTEETKTATAMYQKIVFGLVGLIGLLIVMAASVVCYIVFKRWRRRKQAKRNEVPTTKRSEIRVYEDIPMLPVVDDDNNVDGFELDRDQITMVRLLGGGYFGEVSKAIYKAFGLDVAVKSLKENAQQKDIQDMLTELELMKSLEPHRHVVKLIGCCTEKVPLLIVLEYLEYGDLLGYLRKSRGVEDIYNTGEKTPNSRLSEKDLLSFAWMIADGMNYLSTMKVVHRDLAARNVLVGENKVCKISDFGLARGLDGDIYTRRTQARLPIKWMPPESLFYGEASTMSDIWSFGIVMWEVFTVGESPYPGYKARRVAGLLQKGYRMPRPKHISDELYSIMTECWEEQPEKRPTFRWLCSAIRRLLDDENVYVNLEVYDDNEYINFDMIKDEE